MSRCYAVVGQKNDVGLVISRGSTCIRQWLSVAEARKLADELHAKCDAAEVGAGAVKDGEPNDASA